MGGDPSVVRMSPGQSTYASITLERGVTHDLSFAQWANKVWEYHNSTGTAPDVSPNDFRKDITIELYNEAGQKVIAYNVYRCSWPMPHGSKSMWTRSERTRFCRPLTGSPMRLAISSIGSVGC
jgi:phage tail-like protein